MSQWKILMETIKQIAIYGSGGHGKVVADIAKANGFSSIIWIDDDVNKAHAIPLKRFLERHASVPVALGMGENRVRKKSFERLADAGVSPTSLIHPSAVISDSAQIGAGTVVMPAAVINADAVVETGAIINTAAVIEHDCRIGAFAHISPNSALGGEVCVGELAHLGIGSSVVHGICIGRLSTIGAGSVVINDIPEHVMAAGVPAVVKKVLQT